MSNCMTRVPVCVVDELPYIEARVAFLHAACGALSSLDESDLAAFARTKTWEGLFYWLDDLEVMLRRLNQLAEGDGRTET